MKKEYKINRIFNEKTKTINEIISDFLISFLDDELNMCKKQQNYKVDYYDRKQNF